MISYLTLTELLQLFLPGCVFKKFSFFFFFFCGVSDSLMCCERCRREFPSQLSKWELQSVQITGNWCHGRAYGYCVVNEVDLWRLREPAKTAAIYLITRMLKRSCHFHCNLFFRLRHLQQEKTNTLFSSCQNPSPISKTRRRVKLACLHNLPRHLFLTIWMQSQSARAWGVVSQLPQSTRLQNPAEWRSVTHPIMSVCLSLCLHPPSSPFKSAACTYIRSFSPVYYNLFYFFSLSFISALCLSLVLSWLLDLWVLSHSLHSSSPVCHQGWISSLHLPLLFIYFFISIPWLSPSLSSFASLASTHAAHLSFFSFFFTFWQTSASLY